MNIARQISAAALSILILVSGSSFMGGIHFCAGNVKSISFFEPPDKCPMEKQMPKCPLHKSAACCQDATIIHEGQDVSQVVPHLEGADVSIFTADQFFVIVSEIVPTNPLRTGFQHYYYPPPSRASDITIELHAFLI